MQYGNGSDPVTESQLTNEDQRQLVENVANSQTFQHSPTLRAFFVYVAEHALAARFDEVKEQYIGCRVLGRKPGYDTSNDNIVRIRARQVRQKLDEYFATEGRDSAWLISIPKGGYAPVFHPRPVAAPHAEERAIDLHLNNPHLTLSGGTKSLEISPIPKDASRPRGRIFRLVPWLAVIVAALGLSLLLWRLTHSIQESAVPANNSLWGQLFPTRGKEITVVVADSGFAVWQDITRQRQSLADYVGRSFLREPEGNAATRNITGTPYTSLADVILTLKISQIASRFGGHINVKHARNVDIHDLSLGDVILLGSAQSDPWVELFEPYMSFTLARDSKTGDEYFRNRSPKPGEPDAFRSTQLVGSRASEESYAVVAFVPNLGGSAHVLILEGIDMEGTEAAGEFVCNPMNFATLLRAAGVTRGTTLRPFEAVIKLRAISGGYEALELAAFRYGTLNPPRA